MENPYLEALELVKLHSGTSGQSSLAKCILSLYNQEHAFSIGEILGPLDQNYTAVVFNMISYYAKHGETAELRMAGEHVYKKFSHLIELSNAMSDARYTIKQRWEREHEEKMRLEYPDD